MYSLRDRIILTLFLGSSAICFASHVAPHSYNYNDNHHQQSASDLQRILKPVPVPGSIDGYKQNSGSISQPNYQNFESNFGSFPNSGYQYILPNNGNGYHYESSSQPLVQTLNRNTYGSNYLNKNKDTAPGIGYQTSGEHKTSDPVKGQSSNVGYHYYAPAQDFYGNIQPQPSSKELGYSYGKPKQSTYLPSSSGQSSSQNNYQYEQNREVQRQMHSTNTDGYQYQSPQYSGYNYQKPQRPAQTEASFKGQSYLPTPSPSTTPISSISYLEGSSRQGYSYEKPSTPFKGESYFPLTNGW